MTSTTNLRYSICIIFVSLQNARVKAYTCVLYHRDREFLHASTVVDPRPLFKSLLSFAFLKLRALSLRWCYNLVSKSSYNALTYRSAVALAQKNTDNISTFIRYVRLFPWFIRARLFTRNKQIKFDVLCSRNCVWIRFCCCDCCTLKTSRQFHIFVRINRVKLIAISFFLTFLNRFEAHVFYKELTEQFYFGVGAFEISFLWRKIAIVVLRRDSLLSSTPQIGLLEICERLCSRW